MTQQVAAAVQTQAQVGAESRLGLTLMLITFRVSVILTLLLVAMIGVFSVACLIGGTIAAGGPFGLAKGWFSAVSGL
ncbi:MAG: hypothetical protein C0622_01795 [Desulfuromonas sp.]|nr:MAG: hypothetical protein C0622_01795 [Desulfuromonas sp.]